MAAQIGWMERWIGLRQTRCRQVKTYCAAAAAAAAQSILSTSQSHGPSLSSSTTFYRHARVNRKTAITDAGGRGRVHLINGTEGLFSMSSVL